MKSVNLLVDVDIRRNGIKKECLQEQIAEQEAKLEDFEKVKEEQQAINSELMKLEFAKTDLINKENADVLKQKQELFLQIQAKECKLQEVESSLRIAERTKLTNVASLDSARANRERLLQELREIKERTFDEHSAKYVRIKKEELLRKFKLRNNLFGG